VTALLLIANQNRGECLLADRKGKGPEKDWLPSWSWHRIVIADIRLRWQPLPWTISPGKRRKPGAKAAGVVIDDAAVAPRYVVGFAAARELPIVGKIAVGSIRYKLLVLLPAALPLSLFAPWAITPLLMLGGAYLCYERTEKVKGSPPPRM
jgi:Protein of unknown function (DUF808)